MRHPVRQGTAVEMRSSILLCDLMMACAGFGPFDRFGPFEGRGF